MQAPDAGSNGDRFAKDPDFAGAIHEDSPQRSPRLEPDEENQAFGTGEIMAEMVFDPAAGTHARTGDNDCAFFCFVDFLGFVGGRGGAESGETAGIVAVRKAAAGCFVEEFGMFPEDFCHGDGHRAVEIDRHDRYFFIPDERTDSVEEFLGSFHGEAWDHDMATGRAGFMNQPGEFIVHCFIRFMFAIAVGGLALEVIGEREEGGIVEEGTIPTADVSGEEKGSLKIGVVGEDPNHRRSKNMAAFEECCGGLGQGEELLEIGNGAEPSAGFFGFLDGVKRLVRVGGFSPFAGVSFFLEGDIFFLEFGRIQQDEPGDFGGRLRSEDGPLKTVLDEFRKEAAMVKMGVRQKNRVQLGGGNEKRLEITIAEFPFLEETAIHQQKFIADGQEGTRTGDVARPAQKREGKRHSNDRPFRGSEGRFPIQLPANIRPGLCGSRLSRLGNRQRLESF